MATFYEHTVCIDSRDVDGRGNCKASALLGHLQEAATQASEVGGFSRDFLLKEYNGFWMVTRMWFHLDRPLKWEENVTIRTWHRGSHRASLYRDYDLFVNGERVGEGVSCWVLADLSTRKLIRLSRVTEMENTDGGELCKEKTLSKLHCPAALQQVDLRPMRYSDTDINGHVNNTRYADFACDALELERLPEEYFVSEMQIGYLAECRPGEVLSIQTGREDDGSYVYGLDKDGKTRFESAVFFGKDLP